MLRDCIIRDASLTELFVVRSGAMAKLAADLRDRFTQAVLPVNASIQDADVVPLMDLLDDYNFRRLVCSFGVGFSLNGRGIPIERMRYGKVIVLHDESPKGKMVAGRVLTIFRLHFPELIDAGTIYTATVSRALESELVDVMHSGNRRKSVVPPAESPPSSGS